MAGAFDRKLRDVRRRWNANILLEQVGLVVLLAGMATALAVLTERALATRFLAVWHVGLGVGALALLAGVLWFMRRPSPMAAALMLDERLATQERFSTALVMSRSDDPFATAARDEAHRAAENVFLGKRFPVRFTRRWLWAMVAWVAFAGCLLIPEMDLLGYAAQRDEVEQKDRELAEVKADIKKQIDSVKTKIEKLGDKNLVEDLAGLGDLTHTLDPADLKRQAIRKLGDLADKLTEKQKGADIQAAMELRSMMRRLKGQPGALDQRFNRALANADFSKAGDILKDLQDKLDSGELTEEERKALAKQLEELAKQLDKVAASKKALENALKQAGCGKAMAGLSGKALRDALKKKGLSDEQIDKIMKKAAACKMAASRCKALGKGLGQCPPGILAGSGSGRMASVMEELDDLQAMQDRAKLVGATKEEIEEAMALLGQCQGGGRGDKIGNKPNAQGEGQAWGNRPTGDPEATKNTKTGVKNTNTEGPIIYSAYVKGQQIKGRSKRDYKAVAQAAKDRAAEAVTDNKIPRQYQSSVKGYFDMGGSGE